MPLPRDPKPEKAVTYGALSLAMVMAFALGFVTAHVAESFFQSLFGAH